MVCSYYNYWGKATGASASVGVNVAVGKDDEGSPGLPIKLFTWHISRQMKATFSFIHEKFISNQMGYVYDGDRITVDEWVGRCPGVLFMCWRERFFVSVDLVGQRYLLFVCVCVRVRTSEFFLNALHQGKVFIMIVFEYYRARGECFSIISAFPTLSADSFFDNLLCGNYFFKGNQQQQHAYHK